MTYQIKGLDPEPFRHLHGLSDEELAGVGAVRMTASEQPGFSCRIRLADAQIGERMLLVNHVSHDVANPYRASHAIFVTEGAAEPAHFVDCVPDVLDRRRLSLRSFDCHHFMCDALLVEPGEAEAGILRLLNDPTAAYIHAHNAVRGCFAAKVERC